MKTTTAKPFTCVILARSTTRLLLGALLMGSTLGGCGTLHPLPRPATPSDYKDRHPIVLSEAPFVLDVFPRMAHGGLDRETRERLRHFVHKYEEFGAGPITVLVPVGDAAARAVARDAGGVSRTLASLGARDVIVSDYPVSDPALAAPVRLSFNGLKAKVADRCGQWPRDLASGTSLDGWQNEQYWNFGCATQNMLAVQAADPRDLTSPRGRTSADIEMRTRAIEKLRSGADPASNWGGKAGTISGVGG